MAGLSTNQLVTAAIVAVVVIVSLKAGGGIAHAADKIADITGIPLGTPSIKAFTATPDGEDNMRFQLSLAHITSGVELQIYQLYAPMPDKELGTPDFKEENKVFDLVPSGESGQKLTDQLKKGVITQLCPQDASGSSGNDGCLTKNYKPGGYRFVAVLKKKGKVVDSKDTATGFYDESYVEMLNKPIFGCDDRNFHNCNVIECKKKLINADLLSASEKVFPQLSGMLSEISNEFMAKNGKEAGFNVGSNCGKVENGASFVLAGCRDKDIDDLNIKVARVRLLESARQATLEQVSSEDQYKKKVEAIEDWKELAVETSMRCTVPSSLSNAPKGAYPALAKLSWQFVPSGSVPKTWEGRVNTELDRVLGSLRPEIADIKADWNVGGDSKVTLGWALPIGKGAITKYELKLFHSNAAVKKALSDAKKLAADKKLQLSEIALPKQPAKGELSFRYPEVGGLASAQMGTYWFELSAFDNGESDKKEAAVGIYDDNFIELYRYLKDAGIACGSGCDVAGKKEAALGNDKLGWSKPVGSYLTYTQLAFNKHKSEFQASCKLEPSKKGEARISGCLPEEVHKMYVDVVTEYTRTAQYAKAVPKEEFVLDMRIVDNLLKVDCNKPLPPLNLGLMENYEPYNKNGVKAVCDAKWNLKNSLDNLHWIYAGS